MTKTNSAITDKTATLVIVKGPSAGQRYDLGTEATIGRSTFCDVHIDSGSVSREHCRIRLHEDGFWIEDLNSLNGTFVNGSQIHKPVLLGHKDRIQVYDVALLFVTSDTQDAPLGGMDDQAATAIPVKPTKARGPNVVNTIDVTSDSRIGNNPDEKWRASLMMMRNLGLSLDVDETLSRALDDLFLIFSQADRGYILLQGKDDQLAIKAMKLEGGTNEQNSVGPVDQDMAQSVLANREAVLCKDEGGDTESVLDVPVRTMMCAPLMSPLGKALGVIYLDTKDETAAFDNADVEMLASISTVAGQAVELAREHQRRIRDREADNRRLQKEIEERKAVEDDLRRSNEELQQFAYVASHDLQEPLRAVVGFSELLQHEYGGQLDETAQGYLQHSVDGAQRMQSLISDLLQFSRIETPGRPFVPVDGNAVFDEVAANLAIDIKEAEATVKNHGLPRVTGDQAQLVQLLQHLLHNAIKFRGEQPPQVDVQADEQDGRFVFSVRDNGIGFDIEHAKRIFVIFQRLHTRDKYPGTGIGLSLARKIVHRHRGRIWVRSQPGEGSTFYFSLPKGK